MKNKTYCVIMAGGIGSRFWPMSRNSRPKQFLDILGSGKTFIRSTFERFLPLIPAENFLVVTNSVYADLVLEQLPELKPSQVLGEPIGRNTAPCVAYAAFRLGALDPDSEMIVTPSDHLIQNEAEFIKVVGESVEFVRGTDRLMTIGIKPNHPNTGYGYIQIDKSGEVADHIFKVKTFTEKPNREMAEAFIATGEFMWNSGIFIWKTSSILSMLQTHLPDMYALFEEAGDIYATGREEEGIKKIYSECRGVSIDIGVMEKADNVYVYCSDFGWSDIGTWGSLYQYSEKDANGNVAPAQSVLYDTRDCIIKLPEGKLAVIEGLSDYIVVESDNVLMICPKENEQNIKGYIEEVKYRQGEKFI